MSSKHQRTSREKHSRHPEQHGRREKGTSDGKVVIRRVARKDQEEYTGFNVMKVWRAVLARLLFVVHSLITIWQTVEVHQKQAYWSFSLITIAILIEGAVTLLQRGGDENRWFCPCVFLFVLSTAPPMWFLELDLSKKRLVAYTGNVTGHHTSTSSTQVESTLHISHELGVQMVEQFLLVILIVGRWMLPKGVITREQLSQILLAYLAIASDIVELFDVFKEIPVVRHKHLRYIVLATWSLSLFQFPFVLTASKARKMRIAITQSSSDEELRRIQSRISSSEEGQSTLTQILYDADIWAIVLANFLQDIPFLIVRLYLMFGYQVVTYTMIFFTCKNALIIALQTYRLLILIHDRYQKPTPEEDARRLARHYRHMLNYCKEALAALKLSHPQIDGQTRDDGNIDGGANNVEKSEIRGSFQSVTTAPNNTKTDGSPKEGTAKRKQRNRHKRGSASHEVESEESRRTPKRKPVKPRHKDQSEDSGRRHSRTRQPGGTGTPTRRAKHRDSKSLLDREDHRGQDWYFP